jgi:GPN-loop GTPase
LFFSCFNNFKLSKLTFVVNSNSKMPVSLLVIGMAGTGKSTLAQRIASAANSLNVAATKQTDSSMEDTEKVESEKKEVPAAIAARRSPYLVNLDPAVRHLPFSPNIDIRDTVI